MDMRMVVGLARRLYAFVFTIERFTPRHRKAIGQLSFPIILTHRTDSIKHMGRRLTFRSKGSQGFAWGSAGQCRGLTPFCVKVE
jgi:hypothetical protein